MTGRDEDYALEMLFSDPSPNAHINKRIILAFFLNAEKTDLTKVEQRVFFERLMAFAKKLAMTWRHLDSYRRIEDKLVENVRATPLRIEGKAVGFDVSDELHGELDGFLVQLKSALDYLVKVPAAVFGQGWNPVTFGDKGDGIIKMLERNTPKRFREDMPYLSDMIRENQWWLEDVIRIRDKVNHCKDGGLHYEFFRVRKVERDGTELVIVPMWTETMSVREAIGAVWRKLMCFAEEFIGYTLYLRLTAYWEVLYTRIEDEGESEADDEAEDVRWRFEVNFEGRAGGRPQEDPA